MQLYFFYNAINELLKTPDPPPPDRLLTGLATDSRRVAPGNLFAAIPGPNFDGHDFIHVAIEQGCAAILTQRPPLAPLPVPVLLVHNVLDALSQAGSRWRQHIDPILIAVTGSSGKTTVKEMIAACLAQQFQTIHATQGNLNNHIGLPLTLLALPDGCQAAVVEMGMSAPGEIAHLTRLAQPDIGVITNVQPAHMAAFASIQEVAMAKGELFANLPAHGLCLLPDYDPNREILQNSADSRPTITFGTNPKAMVHWQPDPLANSGEIRGFIHWPDGASISVGLGQYGPHMILNALAAACAAREAGVTPAAIATGLTGFAPMAGRGLLQSIPSRQILGLTLVDDTYNANPGSMAAALTTLGSRPVTGRRVAILADMLELGEQAEKLHAQLANEIQTNRIDLLLTAGPLMHALHKAVATIPGVTSLHKNDPADWLENIFPLLLPNDAILIKGSRGMRMERIVKDLMNHAV